jgi:hypothetical protein
MGADAGRWDASPVALQLKRRKVLVFFVFGFAFDVVVAGGSVVVEAGGLVVVDAGGFVVVVVVVVVVAPAPTPAPFRPAIAMHVANVAPTTRAPRRAAHP